MYLERIRRAVANFSSTLRYNAGRLRHQRRIREIAQSELLPQRQEVAQRLTRILEDNVLPFWYPHVIDRDFGGYRLHHDQNGSWLGPCAKGIVSQARTLWFFSRLLQQNPDHSGYRDAARWGYEFLQNYLWDDANGGFFWEVDALTSTPLKADKHLYGQAFGLYALSAYAKVTASAPAQALATKLFHLLDSKARDTLHGGYIEFLQRNWQTVSGGIVNYRSNLAPSLKTQDTHLHLLEGLTAYVELTNDTRARERLTELLIILTSTVQRPPFGVATDVHDPDWQPKLQPVYAQVIYGHELEKIWLLTQASLALELPPHLLLLVYRTWFSAAYDKAFDRRKGGFFERGYLGRSAHVRNKIWWTQAEAMLAAMQMYAHTGDLDYYACFCKLLNWIETTQVDWIHGDWHRIIAPTGKAQGNKADSWKTPYHNGRALIECLNLLNQS
jgi:mannobiose 2-epimerase